LYLRLSFVRAMVPCSDGAGPGWRLPYRVAVTGRWVQGVSVGQAVSAS